TACPFFLASNCFLNSGLSSESEVQLEGVSRQEKERNLWRSPHTSSSLTDGESDQELQAFIMMRNQVDKDTEEWEKLNYDIHTLKCARREVCARWKKILLLLGEPLNSHADHCQPHYHYLPLQLIYPYMLLV
uniref:Melanoregulin n=1 Tax=Astyanax mexicanus TaxID=7994 RepID=A0A3B1JY40_ASTMX